MLAIIRRAAGLCLLLVIIACGEEGNPRRRQCQLFQALASVLRSRSQAWSPSASRSARFRKPQSGCIRYAPHKF